MVIIILWKALKFLISEFTPILNLQYQEFPIYKHAALTSMFDSFAAGAESVWHFR